MSAPSSMGRTAILIVILAAGLSAFASDAPTGAAHPHRKAATAHTRHRVQAKPTSAGHKTASEQRRSAAKPSAHRPSTPHSAHPSSRRAPRAQLNEARARDAQATPHARVAVERVSLSHHSGVTAEELRQARELKAEREKPEAQPSEQVVASAEETKTAVDEAKTAPGEVKSEAVAAQPSAVPASATAQDSNSAADAAPPVDSAAAPAQQLDEPGVAAEHASLTLPHGVMPPPLRGSHESLERQDDRLQADGLERIENESDLSSRIEHHLLVPVPASGALTVNAELPVNHRYCRPWTARFLADLARAHEAAFHRPIEVSSAVRTVEYQQHLMRINGNAAPAEGDIFSPHLMGATIDIAKGHMTRDEIAWMRSHLLALEVAGKIDVEEEFEQACFHISVYKSYAPPRATRSPKSRAGATRKSTTPAAPTDSADGTTSGQ